MAEFVWTCSQAGFTLLVGGSMAGLGIMACFIVYMLVKELQKGSVW